ncbi:MAG: hypothetical protein NTX53_16720 [candidate division WOR-3 bacterium]|nr:hypothetical protein [candidate division WOR-3 bacterium]
MENPLDTVLAKDPRFRPEAYLFVHDALGHTCARLGQRRHVTGRELLEGIKDIALKRYGAMSLAVLNSWGVRTTDDFGAIVFNLVDAELLSKTEEDRIDDFHAVYNFDDVFVRSDDIASPKTDV